MINNLELISKELKIEYNPDRNNIDSCKFISQSILQLSNNDMNSLFKKIKNNDDFYFNFFNIIAELKRNQLKNCQYLFVGQPYTLVLDKINIFFSNKYVLKDNQLEDLNKKVLSIDEFKKLSIRERLQNKKDQFDLNSNKSIYEDIKKIIINKIGESKKANIQINETPDLLYNNLVIGEVNDFICKKVLENTNIYIGVLFVRKERLDDLFEKFSDLNKNI